MKYRPRMCKCRCHTSGGSMKHNVACCCPHRYVARRECPTCNPVDSTFASKTDMLTRSEISL
jgi:hypothetical protein